MAKIKVCNIVFTTNLGIPLPLEKLAKILPGAEYNPEQFPGLIWRPDPSEKDKKPVLLIFNSGKINVTGAKTFEDAKKRIEELREILKQIGINAPEDYNLYIQNVVLRGNFELPQNSINLLKLAEYFENVNYDPEQFPGADIKYGDKTFLIFKNGKFVCTGAKNREDALNAIEEFEKELIKFIEKTSKQ